MRFAGRPARTEHVLRFLAKGVQKKNNETRDRKSHGSQRCDRILRSFLRPVVGQFSPHFGAISLLSYTENLQRNEKIHGRKFQNSSGDGAP